MPRRNVRRFVLEVLFLAGVAAALTVADLRPAAVISLMAVAWIVVALLEWSVWLGEPHYGRGLPPRYYVPQVALPPPRAVEQYRGGYPVLGVHDDEPTFVASTTEWAAELADWPGTAGSADLLAETQATAPEDRVVPLPPPIHELETVAADFSLPEVEKVVPVAVPEPEPTPEPERTAPVAEVLLGAAIVEEAIPAPPKPVAVSQRVAAPPPALEPVVLALPPRPSTTVLHRIDPLAGSDRGRFWRRRAPDVATVEVQDGPPPDRMLPSRARAGG